MLSRGAWIGQGAPHPEYARNQGEGESYSFCRLLLSAALRTAVFKPPLTVSAHFFLNTFSKATKRKKNFYLRHV